LPIAAASPDPSETTKAKPISNSRRTKEQADISSTRNGNANPIAKLEQAQVHYINYNNPSDDIEDKTTHNNGDHSGDNYHGNRNSSDCNCNYGPGDDPKLVYDPGGYTLNSKDDSMRDDGADTTNSSSSNVSRAADTVANLLLYRSRWVATRF